MSIQKKSLLFFLIKLVKLPLSILTLSLTAKYFGVSIDKDVWLLALAGITSIGLGTWGPLNETFRTKFVALKELKGETLACIYSRSLLFYIFLFTTLLIIILTLFPNLLTNIIAPTYTGIQLDKLVLMIRLLMPYLLLSQLTLIFTSILNAYEVFYVPEAASFISQSINIIFISFFAHQLGIYSLVIALYCSTLILLLFLIFQILKLKVSLFQVEGLANFTGFRIYFVFSIPFFIPYLIGQVNTLVEKSLASNLGIGIVSILDFSRRIPDILNGVLITVLLTILTPLLTKAYVTGDAKLYEKEFLSTYQLGLFGLILFIAFFINGAEGLSMILYNSKDISVVQMATIIFLSKFFAIALIGVFSYIIFGMCMLASQQSKIYAICGSLAQIFVIILNVAFIKVLDVSVFPIAFFVAHFLAAFIMFLYYPYNKSKVIEVTLKYYLFAIIAIGLSKIIFDRLLPNSLNNSFSDQLTNVIAASAIGVSSVFLTAAILRLEEIYSILRFIGAKFQSIKEVK